MLQSTSKANLPLPGEAHGLIRYFLSLFFCINEIRAMPLRWHAERYDAHVKNMQIMSGEASLRLETCHYPMLCETLNMCI